MLPRLHGTALLFTQQLSRTPSSFKSADRVLSSPTTNIGAAKMGNFHSHRIACPDQESSDSAVPELNDHTRKPPASLIDLPRECLDPIYHELWVSTGFFKFSCEIKGWPVKAEFGVEYGGKLAWEVFHDQQAELLPAWLLACKETLYGGTTRLISNSECCTRLLEDSPASSTNHTSFSFGSIVTKAAQWLVIETPTSFWSADSHIRRPTPLCHKQLTIAAPILSRDFKNLSILSFAFEFRINVLDLESTKKWRRLDFSVLRGVNLPNLHTIQAQLVRKLDHALCFDDISASVQRVVAQDISMLGMKLIGPPGKVFSIRVYDSSRINHIRNEGFIFLWTKDKNTIANLERPRGTLAFGVIDIRRVDWRNVCRRM